MARLADLVANPRATVGHIIRYITSGGAVNQMPNRQYLDFQGNCTVTDDGEGIRVTVPEVPAGSVTVGNTVTLPGGSMAYVENRGTPTHAILDFGIPRGDPGPEVQALWEAVHALQATAVEQAATIREQGTAIGNLQTALAALQGTVAENNAAAVHLAGAETVTGDKTFSGSVAVPTVATSDDSTAAASTAWVNAKLADIYYYARGTAAATGGDDTTSGGA